VKVFEVGNHKLLVLHRLPFQLELVDVIEVRMGSLKADDAVNVVLLHEDPLGYLLEQGQ
jgi:hypothetical protein